MSCLGIFQYVRDNTSDSPYRSHCTITTSETQWVLNEICRTIWCTSSPNNRLLYIHCIGWWVFNNYVTVAQTPFPLHHDPELTNRLGRHAPEVLAQDYRVQPKIYFDFLDTLSCGLDFPDLIKEVTFGLSCLWRITVKGYRENLLQ